LIRNSAEAGRVCISTSGRDRGRAFVIKEVLDEQYVTVTDGQLRKVASPKKKKLRHLSLKPEVIESLAVKFKNDTKVFDAEVRSALVGSGYQVGKSSGGSDV